MPNNQKYTIIYPPTVSWHDAIFQRPHQLLAEAARQGHFAIFCNVQNDWRGNYWFADENLCISNNLQQTLLDPVIKDKMNGTKVVFWVTFTQTMAYKDMINPDIVALDYIDEAVDEFAHWQNGFKECMDQSDAVIVVSDRLMELTQPQYPNKTYLIQNGADIHQFTKEQSYVPPEIESIKNKYDIVVGFHGSLQSWLDYKIMEDIASLRPNWGIVLVGPEYYPVGNLRKYSNVHLLGQRPYNTLNNYVKSFDVGVISFQVRSMTQSSNPIKLFEYLAAGIPVVSTPLRECMNFEPYVRIAKDGEEFVRKIEEAYVHRLVEKEHYVKIAHENSWTKRVKDIVSILEGLN